MLFSENLLCAVPHVRAVGAAPSVLLGTVGLMVAASPGRSLPTNSLPTPESQVQNVLVIPLYGYGN